MPVRLVVTFKTKPGKGGEAAQAFAPRIAEVQGEMGCEQFELFRSQSDPDKLVLLELWSDQAALDAHAELNRQRGPNPAAEFFDGPAEREDWIAKK